MRIKKLVKGSWKLDVPMLNEQRFVQILLDYDRGKNKMEMLLKNGFNDFLSTFQKKEKSWAIVMPSAIGKMKAEVDQQIRSLNEKFTLPLNSAKLTDSIGVLLREGESLALLDCLHEFNPNEDEVIQRLIHIKYYKNLVKDFDEFRVDASSELQKTANVHVKL
uniref:DUF2383 domain-containing protein n=1 Tax=Globodera pallida TaxID=36090 RepID=A0A183CNZ3_GLOPA